MRRWLDKVYTTSGWLAAGCIALICLLVVVQVFLNLLDRLSALVSGSAIGLTIPSYADFTGFLLAAASFLALAYSLREGAHIRVILVVDRLPKSAKRGVEIWCLGFATTVSAYFTWYTGKLTFESYMYHDLSSGMIAVPIWIPQAVMLYGLVVLSVALFDELVIVIRGGTPAYAEKGENLLAENRLQKSSSLANEL